MKRFTIGSVLILCAFSVFSLDLGGNAEDSTYYHYSDSSNFFHADTLSLWMRTGVWKDTDLFVQGSYTYTTDNPYAFNIDYFKVENKSTSFVNYSAGRLYVTDFTGYIFSGKLDGAAVSLNFPWGIVRMDAGYTGLLFNSSALEMTLADQQDPAGVFDLEAPRLVSGVEITVPGPLDVKAGMWLQFDLRPAANLTKEGTTIPSSTGGKLNSQYWGLSMGGGIAENLYYDTFAYFETGKTLSYIGGKYEYEPILSFLGSSGVRYFLPDFFHSKLSFRCLYSSGDSDYTASFTEGNTNGSGSNFIPVSRTTLALVFSPQLGNVFLINAGYSFKPLSGITNSMLKNLQVELTNVNFFRSTKGLISESGIDPASSSLYLGTEIDGTVNFRPYSDLGLSLSSGVFIPNNGTGGAFMKSQRKVEVLARLGLSFSF